MPPSSPSDRAWREQMRRRFRTPAALLAAWGRAPARGEIETARRYPVRVTPYYAGLMRRADARDPIFALCMAQPDELAETPGTAPDPFDEHGRMPLPGLIRRYADRAVLLAAADCPVYCRHCTRKHTIGRPAPAWTARRLRALADWLRRHPDVREALVSGGDPLTLSDDRLADILRAVRSAGTVDILRLGTRAPVTLPQRITPALCRLLRRYAPLWVNTHFNHPAELTPRAARACERLVDAGIPVGNQTVLLRGVNDDPDTLETLFRGLVRIRVRPYYLLQCDPVRGAGHFRVPLARGRRIERTLRARLSGLAMPLYVADVPGASSKRPLC